MEMGYRQYARHRGVTLGAVQKAIRDKRIFLNENSKIDSDQADRDWKENTDSTRVSMNVISSAVPAGALPVQQSIPLIASDAEPGNRSLPSDEKDAESDALSGSDQSAADYREHRATRERFTALKQQLEYEQLIGQLISVDEAKRIVYTSFRSLRDSILNVPTRIKDQLAAEPDAHACELLLENELSAALAAIDLGKLLAEQED